jgi:hypothetical protein
MEMKYEGTIQKIVTPSLFYGTNCQNISNPPGTSWLKNEFVNVLSLSHIQKSSFFSDITLCSSLEVDRRFGGTCRLHLQGRRISHARNQHEAGSKEVLAYFSTLKMEVTCSSKTLVGFQESTRRYILHDRTLHNTRQNLRSYVSHV